MIFLPMWIDTSPSKTFKSSLKRNKRLSSISQRSKISSNKLTIIKYLKISTAKRKKIIINVKMKSTLVCAGVVVAVSAFTLTVLSLERFYAICKPLSSRRWQTMSHCYKCLAGILKVQSLSHIIRNSNLNYSNS